MSFTIQYFGTLDRLLSVETVDVDASVDALERARTVIKQSHRLDDDPQFVGYVILDRRGRQVARGYKSDS
jgi:hypothetical protein